MFIRPLLCASRYQATKAAQLRFYETLRAELGSEVGITVLTPGYVESEITKGKGIQSGGDVAVNEEARDVRYQLNENFKNGFIAPKVHDFDTPFHSIL